MKKYNQYFNIFKTTLDNPEELITTIRVSYENKIWDKILETYLNTPEYAKLSYDDPYGSIYHLNIKLYIKKLFPEVYDLIRGLILHDNMINIDHNDIIICLATKGDYRKVNEQFDNEMTFLEYMNSEISEMDKNRYITDNILKEAGFEFLENESNLGREAHKQNFELCSEDYSVYRKWTDDKPFPIKLDIDNGPNNRGTKWHLHIDNSDCETIGCADISTVWEFNTLMQVFKSKFRL